MVTAADASLALLDAVERLCDEQNPSLVSMREIAAEAGVSVGLAYYHFESKEALFGEALDRMAARIADFTVEPGVQALTGLLSAIEHAPAFVKLAAALTSDGRPVSESMSGHPLIRSAANRATAAGTADPESVAGALAVLGLGVAFFGPEVNAALGRDRSDDRLAVRLAALLEPLLTEPP